MTSPLPRTQFNGLGLHLGNLSRLSHAKTRSISPENFTGAPGAGGMATEGMGAEAGRDLGQGWKISPCIKIEAGEVRELADIEGPGAIQQIWLTVGQPNRNMILRMYWDGADQPSVECPLGDFFACGWPGYTHVSSLAVCVNPANGLNCYWEMPFRERCRITLENRMPGEMVVFYQINYALTEVAEDAAYFHAQFRRSNPLPYKEDHTILDGVSGQGHYVGTYVTWGVNNNGWWGEGELKWYIDGDDWPTVCGTGIEDYFCGSYGFISKVEGKDRYTAFSTPYAGMPQVIEPDGDTASINTRFGLYRWHITDPIRFEADMKVTMQALGWRSGWRYLPLQDDIGSVAFWYQTLPTAPFPELPGSDYLEVI